MMVMVVMMRLRLGRKSGWRLSSAGTWVRARLSRCRRGGGSVIGLIA